MPASATLGAVCVALAVLVPLLEVLAGSTGRVWPFWLGLILAVIGVGLRLEAAIRARTGSDARARTAEPEATRARPSR